MMTMMMMMMILVYKRLLSIITGDRHGRRKGGRREEANTTQGYYSSATLNSIEAQIPAPPWAPNQNGFRMIDDWRELSDIEGGAFPYTD